MMEPFIGQVQMFGGNFAPRGWALCDGQLLSISSFTALFSILGTTYGGDGRSTFALPDLRGRVSMHPGHGAGLSDVHLGEKGGTEENTMSLNQLPAHKHFLDCTSVLADKDDPTGHIPAAEDAPNDSLWSGAQPNGTMNASMVQDTGQSQPIENREPFLGMNFIIALQGIYPARN